MTSSIVNTTPYPFSFDAEPVKVSSEHGKAQISLEHVRGRVPSLQASKLRALMLQANDDPTKTMATTCTYDGLSSRLVEEAGFPVVFLAGYAMASAHGLPDTGYIAMQDVCAVIQQVARQVTVPIIADGDTGYGSPMNVKRCVQSFALAGAAGVMIEDQTWPKRTSTIPEKFAFHC
jgi:2-methylisocitrate lyase-like PEP mutase family enzyme